MFGERPWTRTKYFGVKKANARFEPLPQAFQSHTMTDRPERPGPDATSAEIMEWMEEDFAWAVAEGAKEGLDQGEDEDSEEDSAEESEETAPEDT